VRDEAVGSARLQPQPDGGKLPMAKLARRALAMLTTAVGVSGREISLIHPTPYEFPPTRLSAQSTTVVVAGRGAKPSMRRAFSPP